MKDALKVAFRTGWMLAACNHSGRLAVPESIRSLAAHDAGEIARKSIERGSRARSDRVQQADVTARQAR
jgi:hypothetical protein